MHDVLSSLVVVKTEDCTDDPLEENIKIEIPNEQSISVEKDTIELDEGMQIKQDPEEVNAENDHDINDSDENNTDDSASSDSDDHDDLPLLQPINKDFTGKTKIKQRKNYYPPKMSRTQYTDFIKEHFPITCNKCNQHLDSFSALIDHFKAAHNNERAYVLCCDTKIFKIGLLVDHINYHKNPEYFKCIHCDKVFPLRRQLLTHLKSHEGLKHCCDICGRKFLNKSKLGLHKITHMSQEEKMSNVEMKHHCTICDKRFLSKTNLDRHKIRHLSKEEKKFPCQECGKL